MSKSNSAMSESYIKRSEQPERITGLAVWKATPEKGRGVFAAMDIRKGAVIEQSPVTVVPKAETDFLEEEKTGKVSVIDSYLMRWRPDVKGQEYCLGHGFLMLYNHGEKPNSALSYDYEQRTITTTATRDIRAGEEITFDYDCELWFDAKA